MNTVKLAVPLVVALAFGPSQGLAAPILGDDLATFAVLGAETVTNVPISTIFGNVGVSPGQALPGFIFVAGTATADPQVTGGLVHSNTALAQSAQAQLTTARTTTLGVGSLGSGTLLPADLTGLTIFPGVFTIPAGTTNLSGAVTLDGRGDVNAFWLFQLPDTLITSTGSVVNVVNTGTAGTSRAGVFWNVGSSATLNSGSTFEGNILALTTITIGSHVTISCGRALADTGEVTLIMDTISIGCLGTGEEGSNGLSGGTAVSVPGAFIPEPGTLALFGFGLLGLFASRKRFFAVA
jgi:hypothetical protein